MSLLTLSGVGKDFGAIQALRDVSFTVAAGEAVGLMGDNGAGKSTLVKLIAGNFPPTHGEIRFDDKIAHFSQPIEAREVGIEVVYQDLALADNLTAAANVFLGREIKRGFGPFRFLDHQAMARKATELFQELKSETRADDLVRQMSGGQRQAVAISRALRWNAEIIIMDEPTAALGVKESALVLDLIRKLKSDGRTVILISHNMRDVVALADRVVIMGAGRKYVDRPLGDLGADDIAHMIMAGNAKAA